MTGDRGGDDVIEFEIAVGGNDTDQVIAGMAAAIGGQSRFSRRWATSVALLENPGDQKRVPIGPDVRRDALASSYDVATHLVGLCEDLAVVPAIADYLANTPGYGDRPKSDRVQNGRRRPRP